MDDPPADGLDPTEVEAPLRELARMWAARELTQPEWIVARSELQKRLTAAHAALVAPQRAAWRLGTDFVSVRERWPEPSVDKQHEVLALVIDRVTVAARPAGSSTRPLMTCSFAERSRSSGLPRGRRRAPRCTEGLQISHVQSRRQLGDDPETRAP